MLDKIYFGTNGYSGHYPLSLDDEKLTENEYDFWRHTLDNYNWIDKITDPFYCITDFNEQTYTVYAIPYSVDDKRGGSHTEFLWKGKHTEEEMLKYINENEFLKKQFGYE